MAHINADRVKETTTTTGTGPLTLAGAVLGFQAFSAVMSVADTCYYVIVSYTGTDWETGTGTYSAASVLTRTTVLSSSNSGNAVSFGSDTKDVFMGPIAGTQIPYDPVAGTLGLGVNALNDVAITSPTVNQVLKYSGTEWTNQADAVNVGTVTSVSVVAANGFGGTVATATVTPAITLTTSITGLLKGNGSAILAAAAGEDYVTPTGSAAGLTGFPTLNQNTTGNSATVTTNANLTGHITSTGNAAVLGSFTSAQLATALSDETGTGASVFATSPTLITPFSNTLSAIPVTGPSAGNSLTIAAGSGVTSGAGGSLILQAGIQATTGGDGKVVVKQVAGQTSNLQEWQDSSGNIRGYISATDSSTVARFSLERSGGSEGFYVTTTNGGTRGLWLTGSMSAAFGCTAVSNADGGSIVTGSAIATRGDVGEIGFGAGTNPTSRDVVLRRDAADTLAQRRSTNPQAFRVYNTYTDASNYERLGITWAANICTIGLAQAGTGSTRNLVVAGANATTGAGGNVTITAGNGSGVGAGGNIILQPGAQGTSGGDGIVQCTKKLQLYTGASKTDLAFQINNTTTGMWYNSGANMFVWTINNTDTICFRQALIRLSKGGGIYWSNTTNDANTVSDDTGIYSASRGVFAVDASMQSVNPQGGSFAFKSFTTTQAANVNDWVMGPSAFQRVNCTTASSITGIAPYTSGVHVDGRMIRVYNVGTANLTLTHNSGSSASANRMWNSTAADIILATNDYAELMYDSTSNGSGAAGWRAS